MERKVVRKFRDDLRRLERIVEAQLRRETCCQGVSVAQCHTLLAIEILGEPTLGELAAEMGLDKSTLSRTVDGLVKSGLLERVVDDVDRRAVRISLSREGQKTCDGINGSNDAYYERVLAAGGRKPEELVTVFADLVRAMEKIASAEIECK